MTRRRRHRGSPVVPRRIPRPRPAPVGPTPELLARKGEVQGLPPDRADPTASLEPVDVYLRAAIIDGRQHRAACRYRSLRRAVLGSPWPEAVSLARSMVADPVTSDDGDDHDPSTTMTEAELAEWRMARRAAYWEASTEIMAAAGYDGLQAVHGLLVDACDLPRWLHRPLRLSLTALADLWAMDDAPRIT